MNNKKNIEKVLNDIKNIKNINIEMFDIKKNIFYMDFDISNKNIGRLFIKLKNIEFKFINEIINILDENIEIYEYKIFWNCGNNLEIIFLNEGFY